MSGYLVVRGFAGTRSRAQSFQTGTVSAVVQRAKLLLRNLVGGYEQSTAGPLTHITRFNGEIQPLAN